MLQRKRTRLLGFDYAQPGAYFVTTVLKIAAVFLEKLKPE